jgi:hypothetical protein
MLRISFFSYLRMGRRRQVRLRTLKMAYSWPGMASPRAEPESAIFSKLLEYMVQAVSIFVSFQWGERSSRKRSQEPESRSEEAGMSLAQTGRCISRCSSALTERRRRIPESGLISAQWSHTSTRRFCSRPSSVSFEAIGSAFPYPLTRDGTMPCLCICSATAWARCVEIIEFDRVPP